MEKVITTENSTEVWHIKQIRFICLRIAAILLLLRYKLVTTPTS